MSYKIWMTHYLGTWHFLSTMQIYLKSMNSLSRAESTAILNLAWRWNAGRCGRKKAGGHQGFAIRHGQPCYSTPSPMEWHFIHLQDPKKDLPLSPWTVTRMILPNIGIRLPFRDRQHSEIWPLPYHQRLDTMQLKMRKALCSVSSHPPAFVFPFLSQQHVLLWALVTKAITVVFFISPTSTLRAHQSALLSLLRHKKCPWLLVMLVSSLHPSQLGSWRGSLLNVQQTTRLRPFKYPMEGTLVIWGDKSYGTHTTSLKTPNGVLAWSN